MARRTTCATLASLLHSLPVGSSWPSWAFLILLWTTLWPRRGGWETRSYCMIVGHCGPFSQNANACKHFYMFSGHLVFQKLECSEWFPDFPWKGSGPPAHICMNFFKGGGSMWWQPGKSLSIWLPAACNPVFRFLGCLCSNCEEVLFSMCGCLLIICLDAYFWKCLDACFRMVWRIGWCWVELSISKSYVYIYIMYIYICFL